MNHFLLFLLFSLHRESRPLNARLALEKKLETLRSNEESRIQLFQRAKKIQVRRLLMIALFYIEIGMKFFDFKSKTLFKRINH